MARYVIRRLLASVVVLFGVSLLTFLLVHIIPGDVITAQVMAMGKIDPTQRALLEHQLGLDRPLYVQFWVWLWHVLQGNLGNSLWTEQSVLSRLLPAVEVSTELAGFGILAGVIISVPLSVLSAMRRNSPLDYGARLLSISGLSLPDFWIATVVILYGALWFHYIPPIGYSSPADDLVRNLKIMLIPALILGFRMSAVISRMARSTLLEVLRQDYIRTARSKGLSSRQVIRAHALKNAMIPVITIIGSQFAYLLGGTIVLEVIFSIPGVGGLTYDAIVKRDYTQIQGNVLFFACVIVGMNLLVDISYAWLDPRIRLG